MTRQIVVEPDAAAEIERIDDWWRLHRDKHPTLFTSELTAAFRRIAALPSAGKAVAGTTISDVRRVLLPGCRFHIYYRYSQTQVQVLAIWSAQHAERPDL
ncbi:MAG: type II toxin-antitoxin system RelE/ParE family toxin [Myxococcales bacterium]|nr:type II toxin-antitoxin system RelE/ParE family toxin [Myxococcales bacterium]MCB9645070.1 type II toxin-antitoxin system RelE/ParE family toxin [Deltaproteobacteria bacterium]